MIPVREYFRSIGDVWLLWLLGAVVLTVLLYRALAPLRWSSWRRFHAEERGASYALPYVLTFPWYLMLVCFMIQATLILIVKMGTVNAAYASARAAIVWRSAGEGEGDDDSGIDLAQEKAEQAAIQAMTPFASSYPAHREMFLMRASRLLDVNWLKAELYYLTYEHLDSLNKDAASSARTSWVIRNPDALAPNKYVLAKYVMAHLATDVQLKVEENAWCQDVVAEVTFEMPMHVPGTGRVLGKKSLLGYFSRKVVSEVTLPSETPRSESGHLGIDYDSER